MFHIKICGIRRDSEIEAVANSEADAVGLNFFPPSIRYVDPDQPATTGLASLATNRGLKVVGVFVNTAIDEIDRIAERLQLDVVQLHGDESVGTATELSRRGHRVIRAIKLPAEVDSDAEIDRHTGPWLDANCGLLLDADAGAAHGGSGKSLDWRAIGRWSERQPDAPWLLAGGLTVENVSSAIRQSLAPGVDVASGVEAPRGKKSPELIRKFARRAWKAIARDDV